MGAPAYGGGMSEPQQEGSALDAIRQQTSKIEDMLDSVAEPVKPCVHIPSFYHACIPLRSFADRLLFSATDTCPPSAAS